MRRPAAPAVVTLAAVGAVIGVVVWQLHPSLVLANTTITGGDTGAHVGLAGFLKANLLPHGHITGWDPGAYDGFALNTLYFPLPDLLAALGGFVIPFNISFKLVTILGSLTLPVAAWAFGRLAGLERPRPAVLAVATLPFLFDQSFTIYGGNLFSTMAGEYAFSLGLSLALVFLGLCLRGMKTGRHRGWAAVVLAACILCHLLTAFFALAGALVIVLVEGPTRRRLWWMVVSVGGGLLLVSWWAIPFAVDQAYSTNMGWLNVSTYLSVLFPLGNIWAVVLGCLGTLWAIVVAFTRRQTGPLVIAVLGVAAAFVVRYDRQWTLYNVRFLPFYMLCVYLMAGYFVAEAGVTVAAAVRRIRLSLWADAVGAGTWNHTTVPPPSDDDDAAGGGAPPVAVPVTVDGPGAATATSAAPAPSRAAAAAWPRPRFGPWAPGAVAVPLLALLGALAVVLPPLVPWLDAKASQILHHQFAPSSVASWSTWNYSGYERTPGAAELYDGIIPTLKRVGRTDGCGRAMWEYNSSLNRFGTPESLMLLPYWTDNCIDSLEGVLFESSATTPYHFINQAELSAAPSEAVVAATTGVNYDTAGDVALGVKHLQLLGIRYFMASSPSIEAQADADPSLHLVATTGPWHTDYQAQEISTTWKIYEVRHAPMVRPLTRTPDVLSATGPGQGSWLPVAQDWYDDPSRWPQQLTAAGPPGWTRTATPASPPAGSRLPAVTVSDVKVGLDTVSFHVSRPGVPVQVAVSYFPNWHVTGASGPYRAEPNLMVVDPTSKTVTLTYGATAADTAGRIASLLGLVVLVVLWRRERFLTGSSPLFARLRRPPPPTPPPTPRPTPAGGSA